MQFTSDYEKAVNTTNVEGGFSIYSVIWIKLRIDNQNITHFLSKSIKYSSSSLETMCWIWPLTCNRSLDVQQVLLRTQDRAALCDEPQGHRFLHAAFLGEVGF